MTSPGARKPLNFIDTFDWRTNVGGGEGGIRTHGRLSPSTVFETAPFDHSGTSPMSGGILRGFRGGKSQILGIGGTSPPRTTQVHEQMLPGVRPRCSRGGKVFDHPSRWARAPHGPALRLLHGVGCKWSWDIGNKVGTWTARRKGAALPQRPRRSALIRPRCPALRGGTRIRTSSVGRRYRTRPRISVHGRTTVASQRGRRRRSAKGYGVRPLYASSGRMRPPSAACPA